MVEVVFLIVLVIFCQPFKGMDLEKSQVTIEGKEEGDGLDN